MNVLRAQLAEPIRGTTAWQALGLAETLPSGYRQFLPFCVPSLQ